MTKLMTLDQKFIWPSYIDKNDNKLLFDSYSQAWFNKQCAFIIIIIIEISLIMLKLISSLYPPPPHHHYYLL